MHLFKLLKQLTNFHEIWYADYAAQGHHSAPHVNILADYAAQGHHSATHVNILQSGITNNMPGEQSSEVEMALASLILGSRTDIW
jgi:hypothetical protein